MDLFDSSLKSKNFAPLADRLRPESLDDFIGQEHLLGKGKIIRQLIEADKIPSMIFWGPPGVGKTTLASIIAKTTGAKFVSISAVTTGVKEAREIIKRADDDLKLHKRRTILFIDEIHRFNKAQQDAFLPHVEKGTIILIGATTENPSFEVNTPLLSRARVFVLKRHTPESLAKIMEIAVKKDLASCPNLGNNNNSKSGSYACPDSNIEFTDKARSYLIDYANGDARNLLNALELVMSVVNIEGDSSSQAVKVDVPQLEEILQHKALQYDKNGEEHYNIISAFIKSMRNSDANAALYWLARMVQAGEDPVFIARRMVVFASEDVGNADVKALLVANTIFEAVQNIGFPEARINLAQGVVYLAEAPKSNRSYMGLNNAFEDVEKYGNLPVPLHLRNAVTGLMRDLQYGKGYKYAHDFEDKKTSMECLPEELKGKKYLPD